MNIRQVRPAREKLSSFLNYRLKKFYKIGHQVVRILDQAFHEFNLNRNKILGHHKSSKVEFTPLILNYIVLSED
jgi:hypothetical protein